MFASGKISIQKGQKKMKKFLAIVFALIFALSACTVAFASAENLTCESCKAKLVDEKAYNAHINGGCLVDFKDCQYCAAKVATADLEAHEGECPKGAYACDKCGKEFANKNAGKDHTCATEDVAATVLDKIIEALKSVDWAALANKIVDFVRGIDLEGIIGKVKPLIEKVTGFIGEIELPAAK